MIMLDSQTRSKLDVGKARSQGHDSKATADVVGSCLVCAYSIAHYYYCCYFEQIQNLCVFGAPHSGFAVGFVDCLLEALRLPALVDAGICIYLSFTA